MLDLSMELAAARAILGELHLENDELRAAVNAAPHLLAELDALRAQVAVAREAVAGWPPIAHHKFCGEWPRTWRELTSCKLRCNCGAKATNDARLAARRALGLEEK